MDRQRVASYEKADAVMRAAGWVCWAWAAVWFFCFAQVVPDVTEPMHAIPSHRDALGLWPPMHEPVQEQPEGEVVCVAAALAARVVPCFCDGWCGVSLALVQPRESFQPKCSLDLDRGVLRDLGGSLVVHALRERDAHKKC